MNPTGGLQFDDVTQLKWLVLVAACAAVMVYGLARRHQALRAFVSPALWAVLAPDMSRPRQYVKAALLLAAMALIVLALVGPRFGASWEDVQQRQLDLLLCLDVSRSMLAEDAGMSRMARAKDDIDRLLQRMEGGMIGLVCFAGRAVLTCPLTDDREYFRMTLADVGVHSAPVGGTNIGEAIAAAEKGFAGRGRQQRVIIVLTDGEDLGDSAAKEAKRAHDAGILVYTLGIGDDKKGALIPIEKDGQRTYLVYDGEQKWSKMDPAKLQTIAAAGGGEYFPSGQVTPTQRTLDWLYTEKLAPLEQRTNKEKRVLRYYARFHWLAAAALAVLVIETLVSERRTTTDAAEPTARRAA